MGGICWRPLARIAVPVSASHHAPHSRSSGRHAGQRCPGPRRHGGSDRGSALGRQCLSKRCVPPGCRSPPGLASVSERPRPSARPTEDAGEDPSGRMRASDRRGLHRPGPWPEEECSTSRQRHGIRLCRPAWRTPWFASGPLLALRLSAGIRCHDPEKPPASRAPHTSTVYDGGVGGIAANYDNPRMTLAADGTTTATTPRGPPLRRPRGPASAARSALLRHRHCSSGDRWPGPTAG